MLVSIGRPTCAASKRSFPLKGTLLYNPGNVRKLLNLLERAAVLDEMDFTRLLAKHREMNAGLLGADDVVADGGKIPDEMEEVVRRHIKNVFLKYAQNLSRASAALKISRNTLRKYVQEC